MPRIRTIKPEFWRSPDVLELNHFQRLLFIGLWNLADDEGRGRYEPASIAADLFITEFSLNPHGVLTEVSNAFEKYENLGMVAVYEVKNRRFFEILNWTSHQKVNRPTPSKIPAPTSENTTHIQLTESSVSTHGALTTGTGNREQGTGNMNPPKPPTGGRTRKTKNDEPKQPNDFQAFWDTYQKKVDRPASIRAWNKALEKTSAQNIILKASDLIARQQQLGKHPEYTPNPATWLNREGWNDDLPQEAPKTTKHQNTPQNWLGTPDDWQTTPNWGQPPIIIDPDPDPQPWEIQQ